MSEELFALPPYSLPQREKEGWLLERLAGLTAHHRRNCPEYARFLRAHGLDDGWRPGSLASIPPLAVTLFKRLRLQSVPDEEVFKTIYSSGTTGEPSRIVLDRHTAALQSKALVRIMQHWIGRERLPMLIIDHPNVIRDRAAFSARGAGIQGFAFMGRDHTYALDQSMEPDIVAVQEFAARHRDAPVFLFGFTFMVWKHFVERLRIEGIRLDLGQGVLVHGGGWKKLEADAVDNSTFKRRVAETTGITRVHSFYGMVEQVGSVFVECDQGRLHAPLLSDVIVRRPGDWLPCRFGEAGLIEVLSALPHSYPGHALLTEDLGTITGEDDCPCGRPGRHFVVHGRLPRTEARGCSDTFSAGDRA